MLRVFSIARLKGKVEVSLNKKCFVVYLLLKTVDNTVNFDEINDLEESIYFSDRNVV